MAHFRPPFVLARMAAYRTVLVGAVLAALAGYDARALREAAADTAITVSTLSSSAAPAGPRCGHDRRGGD